MISGSQPMSTPKSSMMCARYPTWLVIRPVPLMTTFPETLCPSISTDSGISVNFFRFRSSERQRITMSPVSTVCPSTVMSVIYFRGISIVCAGGYCIFGSAFPTLSTFSAQSTSMVAVFSLTLNTAAAAKAFATLSIPE